MQFIIPNWNVTNDFTEESDKSIRNFDLLCSETLFSHFKLYFVLSFKKTVRYWIETRWWPCISIGIVPDCLSLGGYRCKLFVAKGKKGPTVSGDHIKMLCNYFWSHHISIPWASKTRFREGGMKLKNDGKDRTALRFFFKMSNSWWKELSFVLLGDEIGN